MLAVRVGDAVCQRDLSGNVTYREYADYSIGLGSLESKAD